MSLLLSFSLNAKAAKTNVSLSIIRPYRLDPFTPTLIVLKFGFYLAGQKNPFPLLKSVNKEKSLNIW